MINVNLLYPVGSIYISINSTNPGNIFGGTWERIKGKMLVGVDEDDTDFNSSGQTGGEKEVTLGTEHIPVHTHRVKAGTNVPNATNGDSFIIGYGGAYGQDGERYVENAGCGQAHNNMPPYYTVYIFVRTA